MRGETSEVNLEGGSSVVNSQLFKLSFPGDSTEPRNESGFQSCYKKTSLFE